MVTAIGRSSPARTCASTSTVGEAIIWILPRHEVGRRRRAAAIGDVHHVDARPRRQQAAARCSDVPAPPLP